MYKGTKSRTVKTKKDGRFIELTVKYDVPKTADVDVKSWYATMLASTQPKGLKDSFFAKVQQALDVGRKLTIASVDMEAFAPGDLKFNPDPLVIVGGVQLLHFQGEKFWASPPQQFVIDEKITSVDVVKKVHDAVANADAILGHNVRYDANVLRNYEPIVQRKYGSFKLLPAAMIDIMTPVRGMGISASQAHIVTHYGLGTQKSSVNWELWQHAAYGLVEGLSKKEVKACRLEIRDRRNKGCLASNIVQIGFISKFSRLQNKLSVKEVYPNKYKLDNILGSTF